MLIVCTSFTVTASTDARRCAETSLSVNPKIPHHTGLLLASKPGMHTATTISMRRTLAFSSQYTMKSTWGKIVICVVMTACPVTVHAQVRRRRAVDDRQWGSSPKTHHGDHLWFASAVACSRTFHLRPDGRAGGKPCSDPPEFDGLCQSLGSSRVFSPDWTVGNL